MEKKQQTPRNYWRKHSKEYGHIIVRLGRTLKVEFTEFAEVEGHDDSLPYNAQVWINDCPCGIAFNDGWGGESEFRSNGNYDNLVEAVKEEALKYRAFFDIPDGAKNFQLTLPLLFDLMAYWCCTCSKGRQRTFWYNNTTMKLRKTDVR